MDSIKHTASKFIILYGSTLFLLVIAENFIFIGWYATLRNFIIKKTSAMILFRIWGWHFGFSNRFIFGDCGIWNVGRYSKGLPKILTSFFLFRIKLMAEGELKDMEQFFDGCHRSSQAAAWICFTLIRKGRWNGAHLVHGCQPSASPSHRHVCSKPGSSFLPSCHSH